MSHLFDLTGQKIGSLTVLYKRDHKALPKRPLTTWVCRCEDCGRILLRYAQDLRKMGTRHHIGCLPEKYPAEYMIYGSIKQRCYNPKSPAFSYYGKRGIQMSPEWHESFAAFMRDMGARPNKRLTIERADDDGDYEASNCRWANRSIQGQNQRLRIDNQTGFRGVHKKKGRTANPFQSHICLNYHKIHLGYFPTAVEAAHAYDAGAKKHFGEFARLNFPEEKP